MAPKSYHCYCSSYACGGEVWQRRTIQKHVLSDRSRFEEFRSAGQEVPRVLLESLQWGKRCFDEQYEVKGLASATHKRIPHRRRISHSDSGDDRMEDDNSSIGSSSSSTSNMSFNEPRQGFSSSMPARPFYESSAHRSRVSSQSSSSSNPPLPAHMAHAGYPAPYQNAYLPPPPLPSSVPHVGWPTSSLAHPSFALSSALPATAPAPRPNLPTAAPSLPATLLPLPLSSFHRSPLCSGAQTPTPAHSPTNGIVSPPLAQGDLRTSEATIGHAAVAPSASFASAAVSPPSTSASSAAASSTVLPSVSSLLSLPSLAHPEPSRAPPPTTAPDLALPAPHAPPSEADIAGLTHAQLLGNPLYRSLVDCVWRVSQGRA